MPEPTSRGQVPDGSTTMVLVFLVVTILIYVVDQAMKAKELNGSPGYLCNGVFGCNGTQFHEVLVPIVILALGLFIVAMMSIYWSEPDS